MPRRSGLERERPLEQAEPRLARLDAPRRLEERSDPRALGCGPAGLELREQRFGKPVARPLDAGVLGARGAGGTERISARVHAVSVTAAL